jgi:(heptosyl)LPS beta-1,4-glucosyltransferase
MKHPEASLGANSLDSLPASLSRDLTLNPLKSFPVEYPSSDFPRRGESADSRHPLTAIVLTRNEERWIARCLRSLSWVDELIVIDAESVDQTAKIVQDPSAPWAPILNWRVRPWTGFRDQRNFALTQATHPWVLIVDADECATPQLARKLLELLSIKNENQTKAYKIRRIEFFLGKPIFHGIWNPSYQDRFFHRVGISYTNDVHEYPVFSALPGEIHEPLLHAPDFHPEKFLEKMNRYTSLEARDRVAQGKKTNLIHLLGAFPAMFLKNYFYYGAYKDGWHGLIISLLEGVSRVVRHIKIWQYTRAK